VNTLTEDELNEWQFIHALLNQKGREQVWIVILAKNQKRENLQENSFTSFLRFFYVPPNLAIAHAVMVGVYLACRNPENFSTAVFAYGISLAVLVVAHPVLGRHTDG
jgi:hypothetical protein